MINNYSTKANVDEAVSNNIQKYDAQLNTSLPTTQDATQVNMWLATELNPENRSDWNQNTIPDYSWLRKLSVTDRRYLADGDTLKSGWWVNRIVFFRTIVSVTQAKTINLGNFTGDDGHAIYVNQKRVYGWSGYATNAVTFPLPAGVSIIDIAISNGVGGAGFSAQNLLSSQVDWMHAPISPEIQASGAATAVTSIQAQVTTLDGKVTANSSQVTTLSTTVSNMQSSGFPNNKVVDIDLTDGRFNQDTWYPVAIPLGTGRENLRVWALLDNRSHPSWATHSDGFTLDVSWSVAGSGWGVVPINRVISAFTYSWASNYPCIRFDQISPSSRECIFLRGGGKYYASIPKGTQIILPDGNGNQVDPNGTGDTLYATGFTDQYLPKDVNEKVNTNTATLQITNQTIDGVKAVSTVTVDNNGVMSGYGLISQLVNGQVTSAFGVNADTFYIGSPNNNKKPFIHRNDWSQIDGVWVPPGTYIDTTLIANATIGNAKIADLAVTNAKIANLDASKITTGTLDANRIGANTITAEKLTIGDTTNLWGNQSFNTSGARPQSNRSQWRTDATDYLKGNGVQMWGRDHIAPYSTKIPLKSGDTFVIEYVGGQNSGPAKTLGVGLWVYDAFGSAGNSPWQYGNATIISDLGNEWYRWRRTFQVWDNGSGQPAAFGCLYFQIEQSESESNPAYWTVGDVTVRKAMGGELIVNGAITADKISVESLSAISANLGTIQVDTANIADGAITNAKIGVAEIDTLRIRGRAVTVPYYYTDTNPVSIDSRFGDFPVSSNGSRTVPVVSAFSAYGFTPYAEVFIVCDVGILISGLYDSANGEAVSVRLIQGYYDTASGNTPNAKRIDRAKTITYYDDPSSPNVGTRWEVTNKSCGAFSRKMTADEYGNIALSLWVSSEGSVRNFTRLIVKPETEITWYVQELKR